MSEKLLLDVVNVPNTSENWASFTVISREFNMVDLNWNGIQTST